VRNVAKGKQQERCITQAELLKRKGWTKAAIEKFLGTHDGTRGNPFYRSGAPMKLYGWKRVEKVEASQDWNTWCEKSEPRRKAAVRRAASKRQELLDEIEALQIKVPELSQSDLQERAVEHRNVQMCTREGYSTASVESADPEHLQRWCVNFLRHQCTEYDSRLKALHGRVGKGEAAVELRTKMNEAIGDAYPDLIDECYRQIRRRESETDAI
jgi:hypothetical protein